jgi:predicted TIM-barrel fold metal-dependent hydrolase
MEGQGPPLPPLGDHYWYPLYEAFCDLDVPALVHSAGCRPPARESYSLHFILEETVAVASLLSSDVHRDFPSLKLIISHGGGAIPYQAGRFMPAAARNLGGSRGAPGDRPPGPALSFRDQLRTLWYDTCLYTRDAIELLIRTVGVDRCLFGSEKPGTGSVRDPETGRWYDDIRLLIDEIGWLSGTDRSLLFEDSAAALFRLAGPPSPEPSGTV